MTLEKKSAFVYGDESRCGEICLALARSGYAVGFACRADGPFASELARSIESVGGRALACVEEKPGAEELSRSVIATAEEFGGIGLLVFARRGSKSPDDALLLDLDETDWDDAANEAKAFFLICKYALPYLMNNDASRMIVLDGLDENAAHSLPDRVSSKALEAAAGHIAAELSGYGISVLYKNAPDDEGIADILAL
jgi:3-oxoacyl-[acyl-carrier protein] reductase